MNWVYLIIIVLVILFILYLIRPKPSNQTTATTRTIQIAPAYGTESMAPLSVYNNPSGIGYVLEEPRRNMSYDLRGDPFRIPKQDFVWNNSEIAQYEVEPVFYGDSLY